jgi:hypothetical protein
MTREAAAGVVLVCNVMLEEWEMALKARLGRRELVAEARVKRRVASKGEG